MADTRTLILVSCDEKRFEVPMNIVRVMRTLDTMMEHLGCENTEPIPLPNVSGRALGKVIHWAKHHVHEAGEQATAPQPTQLSHSISPTLPSRPPPPLQPRVPQRKVEMPQQHHPTQWEREFLQEQSKDDLYELLQAANYLDVKGLMDILCYTVASMIRGKDPEQIRRTFNAHEPSNP